MLRCKRIVESVSRKALVARASVLFSETHRPLTHCGSRTPAASALQLMIAACLLTTGFTEQLHAQDPAPSVISESSNLYSALPPAEWSNVESAVDRGLAHLASIQEQDGRFPSEESAQPAVTSLAVMAFLSRGHMPDEGKYGAQISKAIDFVLSTQKRRGYFSLLPVTPPVSHGSPAQSVTYNHSIAGLMLGEVYGMTSGERSKKIEAAITSALIYHREVQTRQKGKPSDVGGFRYGYPEGPNADSDMSVTGWALMFLRSARNAEFNVPKQYFDEGLDFVERCYEKDTSLHEKGVFRYRPLESDPTANPQITLANTASSMLTLILGGRHTHQGIATGAEWFRTRDYPRPWQDGYYYLSSYYSSQATAQVGGDTWNQIFPQIARNLLAEQTKEGNWPIPGGAERNYGTAYSTSLAILALTPAYQLLPIYQR